ncbi:MAG: translation initiation factor 2 [Desulfofundulus sp.]|uniref:translation initiation factor 2 n=1 Tax=Desulfofundulus sp. TaxID=2282750 RepID=UPI003C73ACA1
MDMFEMQRRIQELEEKVEQLRLSRRVLMNLIERMEKERSSFLARLEQENRRLHRANYRYARSLLRKNLQILELESRLKDYLSRDSVN